MILSDKQIRAARERREIIIEPWDDKSLGTNSYDVHLGETLMTYGPSRRPIGFDSWTDENGVPWTAPILLDAREETPVRAHKIGPAGFVLRPGVLYLGVTQEYTETHKHVPFLDGKSSIGRLGITIHCTAGRGDVGFCNHWTMEIHVVEPIRVYAGMPIGQLIYFETGPVDIPYNKKSNAKYNERCDKPQPSRMWKNFDHENALGGPGGVHDD
jgi:dCTP deaminase